MSGFLETQTSGPYCCYANCAAGSKPISINKVYLRHCLPPKIIGNCCELVKLCQINRKGPVFETQCISVI